MNMKLECLPCTCRQALEAARYTTEDLVLQEQVMRAVLRLTSEADMDDSPPALAQQVHHKIRELTGNADPYREAKRRSNRVALELLPRLRERFRAGDPLETAVRLSVAGNVIDLAAHPEIAGEGLVARIEAAIEGPFDPTHLERFRSAIARAADILILGDNAGEIVFDRFLLEQLPRDRVTYVVKAGPIINDATIEDAREAGVTEMVQVIDNGSDAPGTILSDCSASFRRRFETADLIVAKGQANWETLNEPHRPIFHLLMAKCPMIADAIGCELGALVLHANEAAATAGI